jgi:hypothetical protein
MLPIQAYLRSGKAPENLQEELGIYHYEHPSLPLVGFKYHQSDSPKYDLIVRNARGIVLERAPGTSRPRASIASSMRARIWRTSRPSTGPARSARRKSMAR